MNCEVKVRKMPLNILPAEVHYIRATLANWPEEYLLVILFQHTEPRRKYGFKLMTNNTQATDDIQ